MTSFQPIAADSISHLASNSPSLPRQPFSDPNRLAPEDAFYAHSPPRRQRGTETYARSVGVKSSTEHVNSRLNGIDRQRREKDRGRSGSRRRKGGWKKLLWVKQDYPDNYTDPPTFLSHLQRNPRLLPYDFWPLVADSTVIVQHICSVVIFVCSFIGIIQDQVSPVSVVGCGSAGTVLGWVLWDFWVGQEEASKVPVETIPLNTGDGHTKEATGSASSFLSTRNPTPSSQTKESHSLGLGLSLTTSTLSLRKGHSHSHSQTSILSASSNPSPTSSFQSTAGTYSHPQQSPPPYHPPTSTLSPRNQQRLTTAKSAILIYCALLGLSPILKSLTKSWTSDSIWAMSCWLMCINIFFFDYGGGVGVKFPASLSTNAALMASTVLASRLPSTTHVFSLTLFSIEVFGLFPVFRRHLRHISWRGHLLLTLTLVIGAGAGMGVALTSKGRAGWKAVVGGVVLWGLGSAVGMGGCSWWLIGLQKYKNVVIGPWDPARPVIRQGGGWE